jgi:hypothetical protein
MTENPGMVDRITTPSLRRRGKHNNNNNEKVLQQQQQRQKEKQQHQHRRQQSSKIKPQCKYSFSYCNQETLLHPV